LREVAVERKYNSPVSLIQDRYQSKALHRVISLIMAVPMVFYLTAQFAALGNTIVSLSQGVVPAIVGQIVLAVVMLLYETFGGLKGVAITDVLQGCLLVTGTLATCAVLAAVYGPFPEVFERIITTTRYASTHKYIHMHVREHTHAYTHTHTHTHTHTYTHTHTARNGP
jgi:Na+/proline symporter